MANYNLGSVTGEIRLDYDGKGAKEARDDAIATAKAVEREKIALKLGADAKELNSALATARADLERLSAMEATPEVELEIAAARANIIKIEAELATLGRRRIELQVDIDKSLDGVEAKVGSTFSRMRRSVSDFGADVRNTRSAVEGLGGVLSGLAKPVFFASLASSAGGAVAAVTPLLGSLTLLPAIAFAAAGAFGAVKLGTKGMGDAFKAVSESDAKALAESMKELSPNAQDVVRQYQAMKPALDDLQLGVQDSLFQDLGSTMNQVGASYLPVLGKGLGNIALGLNQVAIDLGNTITQAETVDDVGVIFENTSGFIHNASSALGNFLAFFIRVGAVASSFLPQMGTSVAGIAQQLRDWSVSAEGTQKLIEWTQKGVQAFTDLYYILVNVGQIVVGIFKPLQADGQSALGVIRELAAEAANWVQSAEGQETIAGIWNLLAVVGGQLVTVIQTIAPILGQLVQWFAQLPAPVQGAIGAFIGWATVIGLILTKAAPLIAFFIQLAPLISKIPAALDLLANGFSKVMAVFRTLSALFLANPWVLLAVAVIALAAVIYANWDAIWAYLQGVWQRLVAFWNTTVESFKTIGLTVWTAIQTAWTASINAISSFFSAVWEGVKAVWTTVISFFTSTGSSVWTTISSIWMAAINAIAAFFGPIWVAMQTVFSAFINSILAIGQAVWDILRTIWQAAILTIYAILTGQWNLLGTIWATFIDKILAIGSNLWATISSAWSGAIATVVSVVSNMVSQVVSFVSNLVSQVVSFFTNLGSQIVARVSSFVSSTISSVSSWVSNIVSQVSSFASSVPARISAMVSSAISYFSNLASQGPSRISSMVSSIIASVGNMASQFVSRVSSMASQAVAQFVSLGSRIVSTLASLPGRMASLGASIISGIISGISGAAGRLFSYLGGLAAQALNSAKAAFGINSPSKLFRDNVGNSIPEGIGEGVERNVSYAVKPVGDLAQQTLNAALNGLDTASLGRVGALVGATATDTSQTLAGAATATAVEGASSSRTIQIGTLSIPVQGIIDPTDPVSWRRFGEEVRDLIKDVEDSYK